MIRRYSEHAQTGDAYRFFRVVGKSAVGAIALARAEARACRECMTFNWEAEDHAWDGDHPPPILHMWCAAKLDGEYLACLGGIGLTSLSDPYMRVVEAEVALESFIDIDRILDEDATLEADALAMRATFATGAT